MKKVIIILLLFLLLPISCLPVQNQSPTSYIDSITPSQPEAGEVITFTGHGTDTDGSIVAYRWNSSIDGQIGTTALFTTLTLSAGNHIISFKVQDNNGAWSSEVTAQIAVKEKTSDEEVDMEDAIDVVLETILPEIPEIIAGDPYWCLKLDSPLPEGTVIEEDSGSKLRITLGEEMFFFYLDLAPGSYYQHTLKYILVDKEGNHEEHDAYWWPRIDGIVPEGLVRFPPDEDDVIDGNIELAKPTGIHMLFKIPSLKIQWFEGFIVVQGLMPSEALYSDASDTYTNGMAFFNAYKNDFSVVEGLAESQAADIFDTIDDMVEEGLNPITIYIIAHGGTNSVKLGGQSFSANQFHNKMAAYNDTIFNFILGSCHSGSFVDNLNTLDNVGVVVTACSPDQGATPDWDTADSLTDFNSSDTVSEWTSSLLEVMYQIVGDGEKFNSIRQLAVYYGVPETCVLICEASYGALGANPTLGLNQDLDLSHRRGGHDPCGYCSFYPEVVPGIWTGDKERVLH